MLRERLSRMTFLIFSILFNERNERHYCSNPSIILFGTEHRWRWVKFQYENEIILSYISIMWFNLFWNKNVSFLFLLNVSHQWHRRCAKIWKSPLKCKTLISKIIYTRVILNNCVATWSRAFVTKVNPTLKKKINKQPICRMYKDENSLRL